MNNKEELKKLFFEIPPKWDVIKDLLSEHRYSKTDLSEIAIGLTDNCQCEYMDAINPKVKGATLDYMHSNHVYDAIKLLLEYGLDPNEEINGENVMWNAHWIEAPNVAASVLRLLLNHGGTPDVKTSDGPDTLFEYVTSKVAHDEYTHESFHIVQCWLVLMAYGGHWVDGEIPLTMLHGNTVEIFKEFELFDYEIEPGPEPEEKFAAFYGNWTMHIFNKETKEEVALF
jgi:hypothetical protein